MRNDEKRPFGYIYKVTNLDNGKNYIGQTRTDTWGEYQIPIEERWKKAVGEALRKEGRGEDLRYIERAITKYGPENFKVTECDTAQTQEELDIKETQWINHHDSMNPEKGYNLKEGGLGGALSEEAREKLSEVLKERWKDPEYREKISQKSKETWKNPEYREKQSQISKDAWKNPELREKMIRGMKNAANDPKYKEKRSEITKGLWKSAEYREKQVQISKERWQDPKYREKQQQIMKERWQDPNYQKLQSEINKQRWQNPDQ